MGIRSLGRGITEALEVGRQVSEEHLAEGLFRVRAYEGGGLGAFERYYLAVGRPWQGEKESWRRRISRCWGFYPVTSFSLSTISLLALSPSLHTDFFALQPWSLLSS